MTRRDGYDRVVRSRAKEKITVFLYFLIRKSFYRIFFYLFNLRFLSVVPHMYQRIKPTLLFKYFKRPKKAENRLIKVSIDSTKTLTMLRYKDFFFFSFLLFKKTGPKKNKVQNERVYAHAISKRYQK